jgi:hypothetical protein
VAGELAVMRAVIRYAKIHGTQASTWLTAPLARQRPSDIVLNQRILAADRSVFCN